jgi:hypothetical protein
MNTKIKIAGGILAGLVAGATLMGTAIAAPRATVAPALGGYRMMTSYDASGTFDVPTIAEMNSFMDRYRTTSGSIDVNRMHADVTSGKVKPPCVNGTSGARGSSRSQSLPATPSRGSSMMTGVSTGAGSGIGFGMMGSAY